MSLEDLEIRKHTAPLSAELDRQKEKCAAMRRERDALAAQLTQAREALSTVLDSATPNPEEHPTMTAAWKVASAALATPAPFRTQAECMMTHHQSQASECSSCRERTTPAPRVLTVEQVEKVVGRYLTRVDDGTHYGDVVDLAAIIDEVLNGR